MSEIESFPFNGEGVERIRKVKYGSNWPVVYLIENGSELYVGETFRAYARTKQHLDNPKRKSLKTVHVISDDEFNKSATLDSESSLIEYLVADGKFKLQNSNGGQQNHKYFDKERYEGKFDILWTKLQNLNLAENDLLQIRNSDLFKYSPYKTLTDDQYLIAKKLLHEIKKEGKETFIIHGGPGTGKTIVATFLIKQLVEKGETDVALVIAMTALRNTLKKVFKGIPGLKPTMVIGPSDVAKKKYRVLVVDEAHRLRQRKNIPNFGTFDQMNRNLGLAKDSDELDWVLNGADKVVLFYDAKQSVRPSDITLEKIENLKTTTFSLRTQMRVRGGEEYLEFIDKLLEVVPTKQSFKNYDFRVFNDLEDMIAEIKAKNSRHQLCRMVAGYAWEWVSRNNAHKPDIIIGDNKLFWNKTLKDWPNSPNAINEVGCIHTIQGYDLNYAGVIIGPELSFNDETNQIFVKRENYFDANGHRGVSDPQELRRYVINIYKTLLTRGILGTYVYVVDDKLRNYLESVLNEETVNHISNEHEAKLTKSPYVGSMVLVPLYDSIGCGELMYAESTSAEDIEVPSWLIKPGAKYFALRTRGDSMDMLGIEDGDIILCQKNYQASSGSNAVVLIGDDATLKQIKFEKDGLVLIPKSTNPTHQIRKLTQDDEEFKVLGVFVCKLNENKN